MARNRHHPYTNLPQKSFWRTSVGQKHFSDIEDLWEPMPIAKTDQIATAGSCFAQHIGTNLRTRGARFMDVEPAPIGFRDENEARRWGFGVFSARYGNIYTTRQLLQLFHEAHGKRTPAVSVWEREGRFFDALRAGIDPVGQNDARTVLELRSKHLASVKAMFRELDVFVFTLGLTEGWESTLDGTIYPTAPGVIAGEYSSEEYIFRNFDYTDTMNDLNEFWVSLKSVNPKARMLLTVSPVPLAATASGGHVLTATTYSKSVLRAVAGAMSASHSDVYYFPSYEIITSPASRGMFFEPGLRNVSKSGVDLVMKHFFSGALGSTFSQHSNLDATESELICDEDALDVG